MQTFTITNAQDWPMFLSMIKFTGFLFSGALASVLGLLIYIWKDLKDRITSRRQEDNDRYTKCREGIWQHIEGPVWSAIESCCPRMSESEKAKLKRSIQERTEEVAGCAV